MSGQTGWPFSIKPKKNLGTACLFAKAGPVSQENPPLQL
jgi:hypothetical protein